MANTKTSGIELEPGTRVECHPGTDAWMQGDRYGEVKTQNASGMVTVEMDKSGRKLRFPADLLQKV